MTDNWRYAQGLVRAAGGAIIFALPLLMTMEMWWLGFTIDRGRLLLLLVFLLPTLVLLSYHAGFEATANWREDVLDALVAYAIGFVASGIVLWLLGMLTADSTLSEAVGMTAVQTVPASVGAMLARSLLAGEHADADARPGSTYQGEVFIMGIGALFLAFSIAPTEEVLLIAFRLSPLNTILLALASLALMHAFVYVVEFRGQVERSRHATPAGEFVRLTVVGYAVALVISAYVLWTFGRAEGLHLAELARAAVVLGFPAAIGAAAARLLL
jgi:putative integral membrane protein (TIGR02587 family)